MTPQLELYDGGGVLVKSLENSSTLVFPEFKKTMSLSNTSESDLKMDDFSKGILKILAEDQTLVYEEQIPFPPHEVFFSQRRPESPFSLSSLQSSILPSPEDGRAFWKRPVFLVSAVALVVIVIALSLFLKKRK